ncbi:hypothetical protein [Brevibacterium renqingii]|uniref:hypothetical protein n=1 Tax=Brevibacterium renqingii TaxID=2776916 RepID=UPI001ADEEFEB|nr:hypothetical protein [Brevibacterium renqingii]
MERRSSRGTVSIAFVLAIVLLGLVGCVPRPDLSDRGEEIADALRGMPGVDEVVHLYQNGFDAGLVLSHQVRMAAGASDDEVVGVASTLNSEVGLEFDDYNRELRLLLTGFTIDIRGVPDVDALRQRLAGMKRLSSTLHAEPFTWEVRNDDESEGILTIGETNGPADEALTAFTDLIGSEPTRVSFSPHHGPRWDVSFPYSVQAQNRLLAALRPGVPEDVDTIEIRDDRVNRVSADLDSATDVTTRLMIVIDTIAGGTSSPWTLRWSVATPNPSHLATGATVSVGGCDYAHDSEYEREPAKHFTQDAIAVRDRLRAKYDTCG